MHVVATSDRRAWDEFVASHLLSPLTQSWAWGELQERLGRKVWRFTFESNAALLVVKYPLPFGQSYLYAPRGPVLSHARPMREEKELWSALFAKVRDIARAEQAIFFRFDPPLERGAMEERFFQDAVSHAPPDAYRSAVTQPPREWFVDLSGSEEEILSRMKEKTRYNVRLAVKKEITVRILGYQDTGISGYWDVFIRLLRETAKRDRFFLHPESHYRNLWEIFGKNNQASLVAAEYKEKPLAVGFISFFGNVATYLNGGSSSEERNRMAPYAMHWDAMQEARRRGCHFYNLGAITTSYEPRATSQWSGITRFKEGFGGRAVSWLGADDLVMNPLVYHLAMLARKLERG